LRTYGPRARGGSRADSGGRAFHFWTAGARARGAVATPGLSIGTRVNNDWLLFRDGAFENILR